MTYPEALRDCVLGWALHAVARINYVTEPLASRPERVATNLLKALLRSDSDALALERSLVAVAAKPTSDAEARVRNAALNAIVLRAAPEVLRAEGLFTEKFVEQATASLRETFESAMRSVTKSPEAAGKAEVLYQLAGLSGHAVSRSSDGLLR